MCERAPNLSNCYLGLLPLMTIFDQLWVHHAVPPLPSHLKQSEILSKLVGKECLQPCWGEVGGQHDEPKADQILSLGAAVLRNLT